MRAKAQDLKADKNSPGKANKGVIILPCSERGLFRRVVERFPYGECATSWPGREKWQSCRSRQSILQYHGLTPCIFPLFVLWNGPR